VTQARVRARSHGSAGTLRIRIDGVDLPGRSCGPSPERPGGHHNIHVGVQRRAAPDDLLDPVAADAGTATWSFDCRAAATPNGFDLTGPFIQGRPGDRFIYLCWGVVEENAGFTMFRRAKLMLNTVPASTLDAAMAAGQLVARIGLTDAKGNPVCAALRPPAIQWSAEAVDAASG
jgi:hypothetical protein